MISSCVNINPWTLSEQLKVKTDYLSGKPIDCIAEECKRHENTICLELIRQGLMDEKSPENVSIRHTYFEYDHFVNATDSEEEYDAYDLNFHSEVFESFFFKIKKGMSWLYSFFL